MKKTKRLSIIFNDREHSYSIVLNGVKLTSVHNSISADSIAETIEKAIDVWENTKE